MSPSKGAHQNGADDTKEELVPAAVPPTNGHLQTSTASSQMNNDFPRKNTLEAVDLDQPDQDRTAESEGEDQGEEVEVTNEPKKRKKKRSKPKSKRGLNAPTGLEEFFADAPVTAEQHEENQARYSPDIPFIQRILTAIQHFERTRKLTPNRRDIFYKYLDYGGIDVGPNMFQSVSQVQQKEMSKEELAVALSQVAIGTDKYDIGSDTALYDVDFLGCAKAFLSRRAPDLCWTETPERTLEVTTTLERFMDYLLQQDVCPEYRTEVLATRDFCRQVPDELCECNEASRRFPGDFNIACSTLFGGAYSHYDGETSWAPEVPGTSNFVGFTRELAFQIMTYGMAGAAPEEAFQQYQAQLNAEDDGVSLLETHEQAGFEITEIIPPSKATLKLYKQDAQDLRPVGLVRAKFWKDPGGPPEDLTAEERAALENTSTKSPTQKPEEYTFLIEQIMQMNMRIGMRLQATLHKLSCGIWFFDDFQKCLPSFDVYLENDRMIDYETPRWLKGSVPYDEEEELREKERLEKEQTEEIERKEREVEGGDETKVDNSKEGSVDGGTTISHLKNDSEALEAESEAAANTQTGNEAKEGDHDDYAERFTT